MIQGREMDLSRPTSFPNDILRVVSPAFDDLFAPAPSIARQA